MFFAGGRLPPIGLGQNLSAAMALVSLDRPLRIDHL
jgi:hypothetical protein